MNNEDVLDKYYLDTKSKLSNENLKVLNDYTDLYYNKINTYLLNSNGNKKTEKNINLIRDSIKQFKNPIHNLVVYRGTFECLLNRISINNESYINIKSFVSTSLELDIAVQYEFFNQGDILLEIVIPKDYPIMWLNKNTSYTCDKEVLLPANCNFKILEEIDDYQYDDFKTKKIKLLVK